MKNFGARSKHTHTKEKKYCLKKKLTVLCTIKFARVAAPFRAIGVTSDKVLKSGLFAPAREVLIAGVPADIIVVSFSQPPLSNHTVFFFISKFDDNKVCDRLTHCPGHELTQS